MPKQDKKDRMISNKLKNRLEIYFLTVQIVYLVVLRITFFLLDPSGKFFPDQSEFSKGFCPEDASQHDLKLVRRATNF